MSGTLIVECMEDIDMTLAQEGVIWLSKSRLCGHEIVTHHLVNRAVRVLGISLMRSTAMFNVVWSRAAA